MSSFYLVTESQHTLSSEESKVMLCGRKSGMYATLSMTNWTPFCDTWCWRTEGWMSALQWDTLYVDT